MIFGYIKTIIKTRYNDNGTGLWISPVFFVVRILCRYCITSDWDKPFLSFTDYIVFRLLDSVIGDEQTSFFLWFTDYIVFRLLDSVIGGYWRRKLTYFTLNYVWHSIYFMWHVIADEFSRFLHWITCDTAFTSNDT